MPGGHDHWVGIPAIWLTRKSVASRREEMTVPEFSFLMTEAADAKVRTTWLYSGWAALNVGRIV